MFLFQAKCRPGWRKSCKSHKSIKKKKEKKSKAKTLPKTLLAYPTCHVPTWGLISPLPYGLTYLHTPKMIWYWPWRRPVPGSPTIARFSGFVKLLRLWVLHKDGHTSHPERLHMGLGIQHSASWTTTCSPIISVHQPLSNTDFQMQNTSTTQGDWLIFLTRVWGSLPDSFSKLSMVAWKLTLLHSHSD